MTDSAGNTAPMTHLIVTPAFRSRLTINIDLALSFTRPMPCRWWRLWQWILLGWKWEKLA
jgi:hypothetical protein